MGIYLKLTQVQNELKAPKNQFNSFGKYNYRNQEDILEAVKPLLLKYSLGLIIKDSIVLVGDRYFVQATCVLVDAETGETTENTGLARESIDKKGMDDAQVTGSTSSYARKYALNGMFLIDDTKDQDSDEFQKRTTSSNSAPAPKQNNNFAPKLASEKQMGFANKLINEFLNKVKPEEKEDKKKAIMNKYNISDFNKLTMQQAQSIIDALNKN